ncbi:DNA mismatch repair protein MutL [Phytohabitans sp. ZYX-F-186]|uniref:DNA mismatch repair protein MutL n=1 Tax=Phytohabitans maris TaxID=3071409 RepID=A0ABU0ZR28_9ACTN|nr:DNA mismatch repair protein MutL [Phytohabitans sp. ZYX-F-186]MDQ7909477.1 DNA mismatch repair protein MutL [Phytohabitans sp. ZYX-F-186]
MRLRGWVPVLGWCAATLASIGVATVALQPVLRTATPDLASAPLDRAAAAPPAVTTPSAVSPPASPSPSPSPSPSRSRPSPSPTPTPATVVDGWTVTTGDDGQTTYTRSFRVGGGQAVIRMTPGRVQLVTATPNPGFTVDTVQNEPGNLAIQFTEPNHYFVIHAVWQGKPVAQVSEVGG